MRQSLRHWGNFAVRYPIFKVVVLFSLARFPFNWLFAGRLPKA